MLGNGGVFCWYSYINPLLTHVSGFRPESITLLMVLAGFGMVVGNLVSGRLSDRFTPGRVAAFTQGSTDLFPRFYLLVVGHFNVPLYCRTIRPFESSASFTHPFLPRRRNVRGSQRTGRF